MTASLIIPSPGDVVVLPFSFLDRTGSKIRPAIALTSRDFNVSRGFFVFTPLTGSPGHLDDVIEISDLGSAGLTMRSYSQGMLFSANNTDVIRIAGRLSDRDFSMIRQLLRAILPI